MIHREKKLPLNWERDLPHECRKGVILAWFKELLRSPLEGTFLYKAKEAIGEDVDALTEEDFADQTSLNQKLSAMREKVMAIELDSSNTNDSAQSYDPNRGRQTLLECIATLEYRMKSIVSDSLLIVNQNMLSDLDGATVAGPHFKDRIRAIVLNHPPPQGWNPALDGRV